MRQSGVPFVVALILNWSLLACSRQTDEQSILMLKDFYTSYLNETCQVPRDLEKIDSILKKYCTDNLLKQWRELSEKMNYNLLLDGQFCKKEWLSTMVVLKDKTRIDTYTVNFNYMLNGKKMKKEVKLEVIERDGVALIDKIILNKK